MTRVLVLNASYEPINVCTVRRAVVLLLKDKAEVVENGEYELRAETTSLICPTVIRLVTYVRVPYLSRKRITRAALFARDGWECCYCGSSSRLTVDHVISRARGGEHVWENLVTACFLCNQKKGDGLPREVGMKLRKAPRAPSATVFVYVAIKVPPATWAPYLARA